MISSKTCKTIKTNNFNKKIFIVFIFLLFLTLTYFLAFKKLNQTKLKTSSSIIQKLVPLNSNKIDNITNPNQTKDLRIFCIILSQKNSFLNNKVSIKTFFYRIRLIKYIHLYRHQ